MRREDFTIDAEDGPRPTLVVTCTETAASFRDRLDDGGSARDATDLDIAYRRTPEETDHDGIIGVTDRVTGAFVFEAGADAATVESVVETAREASGDDPSYRLRIDPGDGDPLVGEKHTLLVYNNDGSLDRAASLIPGSVEL